MPNDDIEEVVSTDTISVWDSFFINCEWCTRPDTIWMKKVCVNLMMKYLSMFVYLSYPNKWKKANPRQLNKTLKLQWCPSLNWQKLWQSYWRAVQQLPVFCLITCLLPNSLSTAWQPETTTIPNNNWETINLNLHKHCDWMGDWTWLDWCDLESLFINIFLYFKERRYTERF